jgi:hypothetical protein
MMILRMNAAPRGGWRDLEFLLRSVLLLLTQRDTVCCVSLGELSRCAYQFPSCEREGWRESTSNFERGGGVSSNEGWRLMDHSTDPEWPLFRCIAPAIKSSVVVKPCSEPCVSAEVRKK